MSKKFYEQTWFIVLILIFFFPVGLVLVWTNKHWSQKGKIIATVIVAVLVIIGLGSNNGKKTNDTEVTTAVSSETSITEKAEETTTTKRLEDSTTQSTAAEVSKEELIDSVQALLEFAISSSFTNYSVDYNEELDAFCINVTADGIARDAQAVANGQLDRSEWDKLVDSMVSCSSGAQELVNTAGLDSAVMLSVLNDENMDNTLLTIVNDTVIYSAVE